MESHKRFAAVCLIILFTFISSKTAFADVGPKPQLNIEVINAPEEEYYLDLLIKNKGEYSNLDETGSYDRDKLALLQNYNADGWTPALTQGTNIPLFGEITGEKSGDVMLHIFSYMGVPDDFKIIIVTPDNRLIVSKEIHRDTLLTEITYDYSTGKIVQEKFAASITRQFLMTFSATLIIEGIIYLLFKFRQKRSWVSFALINFTTQILLTFTLGAIFIKSGFLAAFLLFIPIELLVLGIEIAAYAVIVKENSNKRRIFYAVAANIVSSIATFILMGL